MCWSYVYLCKLNSQIITTKYFFFTSMYSKHMSFKIIKKNLWKIEKKKEIILI